MNTRRLRAFTKLEVLIIAAFIAVLAAIGLAFGGSLKGKSRQTQCVSNLKQIGIASRLSSGDSGRFVTNRRGGMGGGKDYVPGISRLAECYPPLRNELSSPKLLACPVEIADKTRDQAPIDFTGLTDRTISYFIGIDADETRPQWILTGDRNLCNDLEGNVPYPADGIRTNALKQTASWQRETIHRGRGNIGLADGSARLMTTKQLLSQLRETFDTNNTVLLPKP